MHVVDEIEREAGQRGRALLIKHVAVEQNDEVFGGGVVEVEFVEQRAAVVDFEVVDELDVGDAADGLTFLGDDLEGLSGGGGGKTGNNKGGGAD